MSYSPTNTFSSAATVDATKITQNLKEARDYINAGVLIGDILDDTLRTEDLLCGEPVGVTEDYLFTTGDMYTARNVNTAPQERAHFSATCKGSEIYGRAIYQPISDAGKRFYLERTAHVLIEAYCLPRSRYNTSTGVDKTWIDGDGFTATDDQCWLEIDSVIQASTKTYHTHEDDGVNDAQGAFSTLGIPSALYTNRTRQRQRPQMVSHLELSMAAGWHDVRLVYNVRTAESEVRTRMLTVETFYIDTNN